MCSGIVRQLCYKQCWTIYTNIYEYQDIANLKLSLARKSRSTPSQSSAVVRSAGNLCAGSWSSRRMVGNITAWSRDAARIFGIFKTILQYKMTWRERGKKERESKIHSKWECSILTKPNNRNIYSGHKGLGHRYLQLKLWHAFSFWPLNMMSEELQLVSFNPMEA